MISFSNGLHVRAPVLQDRRLSPADMLVLAVLQHAGATKEPREVWPTYQEIVDTINVSMSVVQNAMKRLESAGYFTRKRRGNSEGYDYFLRW